MEKYLREIYEGKIGQIDILPAVNTLEDADGGLEETLLESEIIWVS